MQVTNPCFPISMWGILSTSRAPYLCLKRMSTWVEAKRGEARASVSNETKVFDLTVFSEDGGEDIGVEMHVAGDFHPNLA